MRLRQKTVPISGIMRVATSVATSGATRIVRGVVHVGIGVATCVATGADSVVVVAGNVALQTILLLQ